MFFPNKSTYFSFIVYLLALLKIAKILSFIFYVVQFFFLNLLLKYFPLLFFKY